MTEHDLIALGQLVVSAGIWYRLGDLTTRVNTLWARVFPNHQPRKET